MEDLFVLDASQTSAVSLGELVVCVLVALALGLALAGVHAFRSRHTRSLSLTLALLPAIVCVVIAMVNGNLGAGVAVAGAFSLVRFRSAPGSARDICFVFLAMAVGLVCGMGHVWLACLVTLLVGGASLVLTLVGFDGFSRRVDRTLSVRVPEGLDCQGALDELLARHGTYHELVSMKATGGQGGQQPTLKLVYDLGVRDAASERALVEGVRALGEGVEVTLSSQAANPDAL